MKYLIAVCLLLLSPTTRAQERLITGRILDKTTQLPITNANIIVAGTTSGSVSNSMGYFELNIKPGFETLLISHIGYRSGNVQIPPTDRFNIELEKVLVVLPKVVLFFRSPELAPYLTTTLTRDRKSNREVEQSAVYSGGIEYLNYYLTTNFKYPKDLNSPVKGETYVSFEVTKVGAIENVKIHNDSLNTSMKVQIEQLFSSMTEWQPAYQNGAPVNQAFIVPIIYGPILNSVDTDTFLHYYLAKNIIYPEEALRLAQEGTVFAYFKLNSVQDITKLEILRGIGSGCDMMVYNAIKGIPKAELRNLMLNIGDSVFVLPVDFRLDPTSSRTDRLKKLTSAIFLASIDIIASQPNSYYNQQYSPVYLPTSEFYSVEGALKHIENAQKLRIRNRKLTSLSPKVGKLTNLLLLDLENNQLQSLPDELAQLPLLEELYAPQNNLSTLPAGLIKARKLKIVGLADNDFTAFPKELTGLKNLRVLDMSNNKISLLPSDIGNLKKLRTLIIRNNNLHSLPDEFFNLKFNELYMEGNNFPEELKQKINESFKNAKIFL